MPTLNFKAESAAPVLVGRQRQTIRAMRVRPIKKGDTLHLYTGLPKKANKLAVVVCKATALIKMDDFYLAFGRIVFDWEDAVADYIAHLDGFESAEAMRQFFEPRFPFTGQLIYW